jgi:hypothetical protein
LEGVAAALCQEIELFPGLNPFRYGPDAQTVGDGNDASATAASLGSAATSRMKDRSIFRKSTGKRRR